MAEAKAGDTVRVHYKGTLDDGKVFDTSEERDPLEFTLGEGRLIPGFEQAVTGMSVEETKTVTVPAAEAYGEHDPDQVLEVPRSQMPEGLDPDVGDRLRVGRDPNRAQVVTVTNVNDESVTLDANHPLAGQDLTFEITLVGIA
ncbi:MAG: FKBP-type peptidyl-prolyl cis-trans isomerase [bacterium]